MSFLLMLLSLSWTTADDRQTVYLFGGTKQHTVYTLMYTWRTNTYALVHYSGLKTETCPQAAVFSPAGFRYQPPQFRALDPLTEIQQ